MSICRATEELLRNYNPLKERIKLIDLTIMSIENDCDTIKGIDYSSPSLSKSYNNNSSVESKLIEKETKIDKLLKERRAIEIRLEQVNNGLSLFTGTERDIVTLYYCDNKEWNCIADKLFLSKRTCIRKRNKIINILSKVLIFEKVGLY